MNHALLVVGTLAAALFLLLLVLGVMKRKGWLGGKVASNKGMNTVILKAFSY